MDSLYGVLSNSGVLGADEEPENYVMDNTAQSSETSDSGDMGSSFLSVLWSNAKELVAPAVATATKAASTGVWTNAWNSFKSSLLAGTAQDLASRPDVKKQIKTTSGNTLGNWILDHWVLLGGIVIVGGALLYFHQRSR